MNLTRLRHIVAVDNFGSMSRAAKFLNLTQSAVTKSVTEMERDLGFSLFHRRARGVTTTDEGREFLARSSRIIADCDRLLEDTNTDRRNAEAVLRVGISPPALVGLFNRSVCELIRSKPSVRLQLNAVDQVRGITLLSRGDLDVFVGPEDASVHQSDFTVEQLCQFGAHFFTRKGHPLTEVDNLNIKKIVEFPIVAPATAVHYTRRLKQVLLDAGKDPARALHVIDYFPLAQDLVETSDCIGVVGKPFANSTVFKRRFHTLAVNFFKPMTICCAIRRKWAPNTSMKSFIHILKKYPIQSK